MSEKRARSTAETTSEVKCPPFTIECVQEFLDQKTPQERVLLGYTKSELHRIALNIWKSGNTDTSILDFLCQNRTTRLNNFWWQNCQEVRMTEEQLTHLVYLRYQDQKTVPELMNLGYTEAQISLSTLNVLKYDMTESEMIEAIYAYTISHFDDGWQEDCRRLGTSSERIERISNITWPRVNAYLAEKEKLRIDEYPLKILQHFITMKKSSMFHSFVLLPSNVKHSSITDGNLILNLLACKFTQDPQVMTDAVYRSFPEPNNNICFMYAYIRTDGTIHTSIFVY